MDKIYIVFREDWEGTRTIQDIFKSREDAEKLAKNHEPDGGEYFVDAWIVS